MLLVALLAVCPLRAQHAVLGERVPEIRSDKWLGNIEPAAAPRTVIAFFTTANPASLKALTHLGDLLSRQPERMRVILVTRDDEASVAEAVNPYLSSRMTVAFDADHKIFKNFGVQYVPFCLLVDTRSHRLLWQGNPQQLTETILTTAQ